MIIKPFEPYNLTLGLKALKKRLPINHEKYQQIVEELNRHEAGELGEQYVLSQLETNKLPENIVILHNASFKSTIQTQIDILVISPSWCLILEVKNIKGLLFFNWNPRQLIRKREDGLEEILGSPEVQVEQLQFGLETLLQIKNINVPIYGAIVFPFNNANIKQAPKSYPLLIGREILKYIWSLPQNEKKINPTLVGEWVMKNQNSWEQFPLCNHYGISNDAILRGVECPQCATIPMKRTLRTWSCLYCETNNMDAHIQALKDYCMLIKKTITSREAMSFLGLRNRYEAVRILKSQCINRFGASKSSHYELNYVTK